MTDEMIILPSSDKAASFKTVSGWVSRAGHFFGDDEHLARYDGSTHRECEKCGKVIDKYGYCRDCHVKNEIEKYQKMERQKWNETDVLYSQSQDKYFFSRCELGDYCEDEGIEPIDLLLIICQPIYATEIYPEEYYEDSLPDDGGEVPDDLRAVFNTLNAFIREGKIVLSWTPGKYAAIITR